MRCMLIVALLMLGGTSSVMGQSNEALQNQIQVLEGILLREPDPAAKKGLQFQIDSVKEQLKKAGSQPIQPQYAAPRYEAPVTGSGSDRYYDHGYGNQQFDPPIRFNNNGGYGVGGLNVTQSGIYRRGTPTQPGFGISKAGTNLYNVRIGALRFSIR